MDTTRAMQGYRADEALYMALESSARKWLLVFSDGARRRHVAVAAWDRQAVQQQIALAKARFHLAPSAPVLSCYEAGRDGFSIHRWLSSIGVINRVVDPASIEVPQRAKRVKTDRIDGEKLLDMLIRAYRGERGVWREVHVPTVEQEDRRRVHRERERLKKEATRGSNAIKSLLATQGVSLLLNARFLEALNELRCWDGAPLPAQLRTELTRLWQRHQLAQQHLSTLEKQQRQELAQADDTTTQQMRQLQRLCSIGPQTPWVLCTEVFGWREIANARQLGALVGFTPTPYDSGASQREQGISKAGIRRVRPAMIELAWLWLRYQPNSALACWYERRFGHTGSKRSRRIGIVALARKLLIALWRYLRDGVIPEGAVLKPA